MRRIASVVCGCGLALFTGTVADAQSLGSFRWQLQPFCNVVTVQVTQVGGVYRLEGVDDQCGSATVAPVIGIAALNPNGSISLGLTDVTTPGGVPVHVDAVVTLPSASGSWQDSAGNDGAFVLTPGAGTGGSPRPFSGLGRSGVNAGEVQLRVQGSCAAGTAVRAVQQDGTVLCESIAGGTGDITAVSAGAGLVGGSTAGDAALAVAFGGPGAAATVARSDHAHQQGASNTAIGSSALQVATTASQNAAVGTRALQSSATGVGNVAIGGETLRLNTTGSLNTAVGYTALLNATGSSLTAVGAAAMSFNTTGCCNAALGAEALYTNQVGSENTALGFHALKWSGSSFNTAVGASAAESTNGISNTAVGAQALIANIDGNNNAVVGDSALRTIASNSHDNAAFGHHAGDALALGSENVLLGSSVADNLASGSRNVIVGALAASALTDGSDNILIGRNVSPGTTSGSNNIFLGGTAPPGAESNTIRIGGTQTRVFFAGIHAQTSATGIPVMVNLFGQLGTTTSSRRFKDDIVPLSQARRVIQALTPVQFVYKPQYDDGARQVQYGLIAEEVERVDPNLVLSVDGQVETVRYHFLPPLLVAEVQRLEHARAALDQQLHAQREEIATLGRQVAELKAMLTTLAERLR